MSKVLAGQPGPLLDSAERYIASAERIADAARFLTELALSGRGDAISAITVRATDSAADLTRAHGRYSGTAHALRTYAVELSELHRRAQQMAEAEATNAHQAAVAAHNVNRLERTRDIHEQNGATPQVLQQIEDQIMSTERRRQALEQNAAHARQALRSLADQLDEAAERAISKINLAAEGTNDSFWEKLAAFVDDVGSFFASVGRWAQEFLAKVLEFVLTAIAVVAIAILAIVIIIAAVALLAVAIVVLAKVLAFLLTNPLFWTLVGVLFGFVLLRVASTVPLPWEKVKVSEYSRDGAEPEQLDAADDLRNQKNIDSLDDFFANAGAVDEMGRSEKTVIDVKKIIDEDGNVSWVVTLPSTQDWQALSPAFGGDMDFNDDGAVNDADTILALRLFPDFATAYERAVLDAMLQAGVPSGPNGDPVLLVGFSQGGIMAAHLATHRSDEYNFAGVLVAGAPVDSYDIPPTTTVVSLQHEGDIVHQLDLTGPKHSELPDSQAVYEMPNPDPTRNAHDVNLYRHTSTLVDSNDPAVEALLDQFSGRVVDGASESRMTTFEYSER